jgi:hypothetical protein
MIIITKISFTYIGNTNDKQFAAVGRLADDTDARNVSTLIAHRQHKRFDRIVVMMSCYSFWFVVWIGAFTLRMLREIVFGFFRLNNKKTVHYCC